MTENPERFTGYAGPSSGRVWKAIYEENCFDIVHQMTEGCETCNNIMNLGEKSNGQSKSKSSQISSNPKQPISPFAHVPDTKEELHQFLNNLAEESDGGMESDDEVCLEKRVYYRLISGLHSSISIHICDEWFDQKTGVWVSNYKKYLLSICFNKNFRVPTWIVLLTVLDPIPSVFKMCTLLMRSYSELSKNSVLILTSTTIVPEVLKKIKKLD